MSNCTLCGLRLSITIVTGDVLWHRNALLACFVCILFSIVFRQRSNPRVIHVGVTHPSHTSSRPCFAIPPLPKLVYTHDTSNRLRIRALHGLPCQSVRAYTVLKNDNFAQRRSLVPRFYPGINNGGGDAGPALRRGHRPCTTCICGSLHSHKGSVDGSHD